MKKVFLLLAMFGFFIQSQAQSVMAKDTLSPQAPFRVVNIGGGQPVSLMDFVETIEKTLGRKAIRKRFESSIEILPLNKVVSNAERKIIESLT